MRRCLFCFAQNGFWAIVCDRCGLPLDEAPALFYGRSPYGTFDRTVLDRALERSGVTNIPLSSSGGPVTDFLMGRPAELDELVAIVSGGSPKPHTILFLADPEKPPLARPGILKEGGFKGFTASVSPLFDRWSWFSQAVGNGLQEPGTFMNRGGQILRGVGDDEVLTTTTVLVGDKKMTLGRAARDEYSSGRGGTFFDLGKVVKSAGPAVVVRGLDDKHLSEWRSATRSDDLHISNAGPPPVLHEVGEGESGTGFVVEQRYLEASFAQKVRLGDEPPLDARIALSPVRPGAYGASLDLLRIPEGGLPVKLSVHCSEGFKVTPPLHTILVPRGKDSKWVQFTVTALHPGAQYLEIIAYVDGVQAGGLRIDSTVDELAPTADPRSVRGDLTSTRREPGDVTLDIGYDQTSNSYRYKWFDFADWVPSDEIAQKLSGAPSDRVKELLTTINDIARQRAGLSQAAARQLLKNSGIELWRQLIPEKLEEEFWSRHKQTRRLLLRPRNDQIPWELLHPPDDAGFLVEQFIVSRWSETRRIPSVIEMKRGETVVPPHAPAGAKEEIEAIGKLLQPGTSLAPPIDNLDVLLRRLGKAEFQLLHFACHHNYMAGSAAGITFGDALFRPTFLEDKKFSGPLVFINACRADHKEATFTGMSSWADKFIARGAGAFIGTLWDVRDAGAREFAKAFYQRIAEGKSLGEAMREARNAIRDPSDPTWLGYTLYGDPGASIAR